MVIALRGLEIASLKVGEAIRIVGSRDALQPDELPNFPHIEPGQAGRHGTVDQELLLRNEYLAAENRILKAKLKGRVRFSDAERAVWSEISYSRLATGPQFGHRPSSGQEARSTRGQFATSRKTLRPSR
jgi:hypothetical protein